MVAKLYFTKLPGSHESVLNNCQLLRSLRESKPFQSCFLLFLQLNLKLGGGVQANSAISPASIKQRLGSYREYLWKQCLNCADRIGQWRPGGQKKGRRKSQSSTGEIGDIPAQQYWGPLIGTVIQKLIIPFGNSTIFLSANDKKMSVLITKPNQKVMHNN